MKICAAQICPAKGDIAQNIAQHIRWIEVAATRGADFIFFPELSLTGYEPPLADALAMPGDDSRLDVFQSLADAHALGISVGVPTRGDSGIYISLVIFRPGEAREIYSKQHLHEDEFPYFVPGNRSVILGAGSAKLAPAICYESLQPQHAGSVAKQGANVYMASVAKSAGGVKKAVSHYPEMARTHGMAVLMANCIGACDTFESVGQSAVWDKKGNLLAQLNDTEEGLLLFDTETEKSVIV